MTAALWPVRRLMGGMVLAAWLLLAGAAGAWAQSRPALAGFAPLDRWADAVRSGDVMAIQSFYSWKPPVTFLASTGFYNDASREAKFWAAWKRAGLTRFHIDLIHSEALSPSVQEVFFEGGLAVNSITGPHTFYLFVQQIWQRQGAKWAIVNGSRTDLSRLKQPASLGNVIYPPANEAAADVAAAVRKAGVEHKRVLLDFGGNWCYDCHVLDLAFYHSALTPLLESNYVVVEINVGEFDKNLDLAKKYRIPLEKGVPALAVLDSHGNLLTSQQNGEFEAARSLAPEDLIQFLNEWKPQ